MTNKKYLAPTEPDDAGQDATLAELIKRGATMEEIARLKEPKATTPDEALRALKVGNSRFFSGMTRGGDLSALERRASIMGQTPFAVVLGCADSRVPLEIIFDQGAGDLFAIRVAGNVVADCTLGSIEYAIVHLKVHLIVIMGHEGCGAVTAAMMDAGRRTQEPTNIQGILNKIVPAVSDIAPIRDGKARMREAVIANVRHQVHLLKQNPVISDAIANKRIAVVGAYYEISSGAVDFMESEEALRL